jgi:hypothetical protein
VIVLELPSFKISIELNPDPPDSAKYIEVRHDYDKGYSWFRLTAAEATTLADALRVAAMRGRPL